MSFLRRLFTRKRSPDRSYVPKDYVDQVYEPLYDEEVDSVCEGLLADMRDILADAVREARNEGRSDLSNDLARLLIDLDYTVSAEFGHAVFK